MTSQASKKTGSSKNERKTEILVRTALSALSYYDEESSISVEEQRSELENVKKLLKGGSKSGKGGQGACEFIISNQSDPDILVIIECKADVKDHESPAVAKLLAGKPLSETPEAASKRIMRFAVDGALHYAECLSKEFIVVAVAVSGETKSALTVSTYLYTKGADKPALLRTKAGKEITKLLSWEDYVEHATFDPKVQRLRFEELMAFASDLHVFMRDHAKLTESEKPLLVSGTLIALKNKPFALSYDAQPPEKLQKEWMRIIKEEINSAEIPKAKKDSMTQPYSSIAVHPELGRPTRQFPKGVLHELVKQLNEKVWPFISIYHDFDVVGQFYGEFLKYTAGDKKGLGIVLTPRHITELFARLANVNKSSKVLDICAGTGGFLVSAMHQMIRDAQTAKEQDLIKSEGLVGVEQQPNMFALAASNMILRGDGKANLYQGSCFDPKITKDIKAHACTVGLLNPPFSQSDASLHELQFTKHMLDCLEPNGVGIAIMPMSCAITPNPLKAEILKYHTLEAVMSMPDQLFYPVGTITCIMILKAHVPHATSNIKTWFGFWKSDGYEVVRHRGRIDPEHRWEEIRDTWVEMFRNREVHPGKSITKHVNADNEWCAEAYLETDYAHLGRAAYELTVKRFLLSQLLNEAVGEDADSLEKDD
ncbi:HsdM family class I SAM-dependent methyltransferase [Burkholderia glumae]|uniref:HsdM family class I SAM-dependent methyltransferase n=1 Tax=Burkholderia glumae TaxID=337 RepID=UPI00214A4DC6|nr:SAM-dependent methyltransferase [Burkholderia glumae]MCR1768922.1 N-6 DNA methylase [Burkholderia glumae]